MGQFAVKLSGLATLGSIGPSDDVLVSSDGTIKRYSLSDVNTKMMCAIYGGTTYADISDAYSSGIPIFMKFTDGLSYQIVPMSGFDAASNSYTFDAIINGDCTRITVSLNDDATVYTKTLIYPLASVYVDAATGLSGDGSSINDSIALSTFSGPSSTLDGKSGGVPAPKIADSGKFLRADATWQTVLATVNTTLPITGNGTSDNPVSVATFAAATESSAGTPGVVPAPAVTDTKKFLRGDGVWSVVQTFAKETSETAGVDGIVPAPAASNDEHDFLCSDGTWRKVHGEVFTGASAEANGEYGFVPAPNIDDRESVLAGDGNWSTLTGISNDDIDTIWGDN